MAPLVSPQWLAERISDDGLLVIDIRSAVDGGGRAAYEQGHVPRSLHTDYVKDGWRATKGAATGLLPDAAHLSALFTRVGLRHDHHAIIVSAGTSVGDFSAAARVYWTLKMAGHREISILDGGFAGWRADAARPIETGSPRERAPVPAYAVNLVAEPRADIAAVEAALSDRSAVLLDSRSAAYFEGREKSPQAARPGRLPGAVHLDHSGAFDTARGRLKSSAELEKLFAIVPPRPTINYCNTGQQAATNWFVLSEVLGRPFVTLYDGSMSEWTEQPGRPVEVGADAQREASQGMSETGA
jgi:thiosulfate/3-mercaptopyruvate sulfurtransferase